MIAVKDLNVCTIQYADNGLSFFEVVRIDICSFITVNPSSLTVCLKCGASFYNQYLQFFLSNRHRRLLEGAKVKFCGRFRKAYADFLEVVN